MKAQVKNFIYLLLLSPATALAFENPFDFKYPPTDLSVNYLSNIFGRVDGVLAGGGSQILGEMFAVFNAAVLSLGAVIIMYVLIVSTLNTAHEGQVLGKKWSSVWTPARSAAGIALLLPKASGYCLAQIIVMWVVVQGVGAADAMWSASLDYLQRGGILVQQTVAPTAAGDDQGQVDAIMNKAGSILKSQICMYGLQEVLQLDRADKIAKELADPGPVPSFGASIDLYAALQSESPRIDFPGDLRNGPAYYRKFRGLCGSVSWTNVKTEGTDLARLGLSYTALEDAKQSRAVAVSQMISSLSPVAENIVRNRFHASDENMLPLGKLKSGSTTDWVGTAGKSPLLHGTEIQDAAVAYIGLMRPTWAALTQDINTDGQREFINEAKAKGWILAGSYYFDLTELNTAASTILGTENKKVFVSEPGGLKNAPELKDVLLKDVATLDDISKGQETVDYINDAKKYELKYGQAEAEMIISADAPKATQRFQMNIPIGFFGIINYNINIDSEEISNRLTSPIIKPMQKQVTKFIEMLSKENRNPIMALAEHGKNMLNTVIVIWWSGAIITLVASLITHSVSGWVSPGASVFVLIMWLLPLLTVILTYMMTVGALLGYLVPLIPFILFVFGGLSWFIAVMEAMIAAPLVALGIAHPEGSEAFGKAEPAIMLILNIFLRPSMMLIGFIAGIVLSYVAIWMLNVTFFRGVQGLFGIASRGGVTNTPVIGFIAVIVIYSLIVVGIIERSFSLIYMVPDRVMRWLSGGSQASFGGGEEGMFKSIRGGFEGMAQQGAGGASGGISAAVQAGATPKKGGGKKGGGGTSAKGKGGGGKGGKGGGGKGGGAKIK